VGNPAEETCCYPNAAMLHSRIFLSTGPQTGRHPDLAGWVYRCSNTARQRGTKPGAPPSPGRAAVVSDGQLSASGQVASRLEIIANPR
jgi:hypothetical protein